jgi:toxin YoeB
MSKTRSLCFDDNGWNDYLFWQKENTKLLNKINSVLKEITRTPFHGTGKPEALKGDFSGLWSRRITDEHRIVYAIRDDQIVVLQCRYHYSKH